MTTPAFNITHLAKLARLTFTPEEAEKLARDLGNILTYVEKLNSLDLASVEPTSHVLNIENVYRDDVAMRTVAADAVLAALPASSKDGHFFKVPKVIEEQ